MLRILIQRSCWGACHKTQGNLTRCITTKIGSITQGAKANIDAKQDALESRTAPIPSRTEPILSRNEPIPSLEQLTDSVTTSRTTRTRLPMITTKIGSITQGAKANIDAKQDALESRTAPIPNRTEPIPSLEQLTDSVTTSRTTQNVIIHHLPKVEDRVETAIQKAVDHVTPCPIEAKDDNKENIVATETEKWREQIWKLSDLPSLYMQLSKSRLTGLVVLSAVGGYGMAPAVFEPTTCALMALGTFMTSCSANTVNQYFEIPYDSQMARTRNRVLVRGLLSPLHAVSYATIVGIAGITTLGLLVNPLAAAISASTWGLYVMAYTPLKRVSMVNTWVGALVGALPPMIGWAACTGGLEAGAFLMAAYLYSWQFPHFNALSWNLRSDYSRGGYCMMSTTNPALCRRVALRHCLGMIGLCTLAPVLDLTTWTFAIDSLPLNIFMTYLGYRFYKNADSKSAKQLFRFTLLHLPVLMMLLLISKKNLHPQDSGKVVGVKELSTDVQ